MVGRPSTTRVVDKLTSDKLATWGEVDWGKGEGVEEEVWVRTEIIVEGIVGEKRRRRGGEGLHYIRGLANA